MTYVQPGNLLTTKQAAERLHLKETTMTQWRWQGVGPVFVKLGRCVRYRITDLDSFADARVFTSTTAAQHGQALKGERQDAGKRKDRARVIRAVQRETPGPSWSVR